MAIQSLRPLKTSPQHLASDPKVSAWVSASAGSGKTKVLTDRLLNLMLEGFSSDRLVCLTFTKAAAAEMANRLTEKLAKWAVLEESDLYSDLENTLGFPPDPNVYERAKTLFTNVLETPGGMKILTIHSFCQSILTRFPLEAQIPPNFSIADDKQAEDILTQARDLVLIRHKEQPLAFLSEATFDKILKDIINQRSQFASVLQHYPTKDYQETYLKKSLDIPDWIDLSHPNLVHHILNSQYVLSENAKSFLQESNDPIIQDWILFPERRPLLFDMYKSFYLTSENKILKKQKIPCSEEAEQVHQLCLWINRAINAQATLEILTLAHKILTEYQLIKKHRSVLDYDDLIETTRSLLEKPGIASWILFKLDGGIDHLLIDEAQDTNPQQWQVIQSLTADFFTTDKSYRTIFAVGDIKQSIFSFQGAKPEEFLRLQKHFSQYSKYSGQTWRDIGLDVSFRSTPEVLAVVDEVFCHPENQEGITFDRAEIKHLSFRQKESGLVEVWPVVFSEEEEEAISWSLPTQSLWKISPEQKVALKVAESIRQWLDRQEILPSTQKPIEPKDILILVRKRSTFVEEVIRALSKENIPVSGSDRLILTDHIAIADLLALGQFLLLPEDDYSLACLLKSPLIDLDEQSLFDLSHDRSSCLWMELIHRQKENPNFQSAYDFLSNVLDKVDYDTPYDLYAYVLIVLEGRKKFISRLGHDVEDVLDEFLNQALLFEQTSSPTLQGFISHLTSFSLEIKRDTANLQRNEVRLMTIHGSKGLQAPVIILPEHLDSQDQWEPLLWETTPNGTAKFVFKRPASNDDSSKTAAVKITQRQKDKAEDRRLLYVALTRAQDRLYVCGWCKKKKEPEKSWHKDVRTALKSLKAHTLEEGILRYGCAPLQQDEEIRKKTLSISCLPAWVSATLPPSQKTLEKKNAQITSETAERGIMIHRLFEVLPDFPPSKRPFVAHQLLKQQGYLLSEKEDIIEKTLTLIESPEFCHLFGPNSRAEVDIAVGGTLNRLDRLIITSTSISIIDFKTSTTIPSSIADVPEAYIQQLDRYAESLKKIYPHHTYQAYLLWTEGPYLMKVL